MKKEDKKNDVTINEADAVVEKAPEQKEEVKEPDKKTTKKSTAKKTKKTKSEEYKSGEWSRRKIISTLHSRERETHNDNQPIPP